MNWRSFWEQYEVSIHSREQLSDPEMLAYLRQALKDGPAKRVIEGLWGPEMITLTQLNACRNVTISLMCASSACGSYCRGLALNEDKSRNLTRMHDISSQHLLTLKAVKYEPSGAFITALLEMKLEQSTMFELQRHAHRKTNVPHFMDFFLTLQIYERGLQN